VPRFKVVREELGVRRVIFEVIADDKDEAVELVSEGEHCGRTESFKQHDLNGIWVTELNERNK